MEAAFRQAMANQLDKLTDDQLDDAESIFDNLSVLIERVITDENNIEGHYLGLEPHLQMFAEGITQAVNVAYADEGRKAARTALYNGLTQVFLFGYEAGKLNWPLKRKDCGEVHS